MEDNIMLVLATRNKSKIVEISELLLGFPIIIKNFDDFGTIPEVEENGDTFEKNAYKKASFAARILGYPAMADDSGLCVEALGGLPGIYSARYAGENATDEQRCEKLLLEMEEKENRRAYFECVISIAVPTGVALTYEAKSKGFIAKKPSGSNGFGYDPIFFYPDFKKTFAEMSREEKGKISHRGKALTEVKGEFDKVITWIGLNMPVYEKFKCDVKCV